MAQALEVLLIQFHNDAQRRAEEQIRRLLKDPQTIPALVHHMRTAKTSNVRQLAAVLLRKKITGHWPKLSPNVKSSIKSALIDLSDSITLEHRKFHSLLKTGPWWLLVWLKLLSRWVLQFLVMLIVMPLVLKEPASSEATNRRNAAFCAGEICKTGGAVTLKYYGDIVRALYPLFGESEPDFVVKDNAAGSIARMIMVQPQSIPLNQVLPSFLKAFPLKEDREESMAVYSCICNLILSSNPQILAVVPELVHVFAQVAVSPAESDEVKAQIGMAFSHLISTCGQQMQPILSAL